MGQWEPTSKLVISEGRTSLLKTVIAIANSSMCLDIYHSKKECVVLACIHGLF